MTMFRTWNPSAEPNIASTARNKKEYCMVVGRDVGAVELISFWSAAAGRGDGRNEVGYIVESERQ